MWPTWLVVVSVVKDCCRNHFLLTHSTAEGLMVTLKELQFDIFTHVGHQVETTPVGPWPPFKTVIGILLACIQGRLLQRVPYTRKYGTTKKSIINS